MKNNQWMTWLQATVLSFLLGFCAIAVLVTGLDLPVNLWLVARWCLLAGAVCGFCCGRRLGLVPLGAVVVAVGIFIYNGQLLKSLQSMIYYLSVAYNGAFGWKILHLGGLTPEQMESSVQVVLCLWGSLTAMVVAWSVTKGQSGVPAVLMALPAPIGCLVVAESTPGSLWLWLLVFGIIMISLTAATRFDEEKRGNRVFLYTAVPVALAVVLLFSAVPRSAYAGQDRAKAWSDALLSRSVLRQAWDVFTGKDEEILGADTRKVSLADVGPQSNGDGQVMVVTADYSGTMYLRSSGLDTYDGKNWTNSGSGTSLNWPDESVLGQTSEVLISTRYAHSMLYMPYYVTSMDLNGVPRGIENENRINSYSVTWSTMPDVSYFNSLYPDPTDNPHVVAGEMASQCTSLPEYTENWAKPLADKITAGKYNSYHKALAIGEYVKNSATYDLSTKKMPRGEGDFVRWFLERSDSGYCVHFASAATVLLKAAGIPARYVVGYMVTVERGIATSVTEQDAHAWVEYWLPGFGWTVLESTPSAPTGSADGLQTKAEKAWTSFRLPSEVWILLAALVPVAVILRWRICVARRNRRLKAGDQKQKVVARYGRLEELHLVIGEQIDPSVTALAEKAKFSPHPMTDEDVAVLDSALDEAKGKFRRQNLFKQLYYRLVRGIL